MLAAVEKKIEGEEITAPPEEEPETQVIDLMEALKASVEGGAKRKATASKGKKRGKKAAAG